MKTMSGVSRHGATELATSLAMMHATLESTTDAILVTDAAFNPATVMGDRLRVIKAKKKLEEAFPMLRGEEGKAKE
jgi:hypothetical protein